MEYATRKKVQKAKFIGSGYFIVLALVYLIASIFDEHFDTASIYIILLVSLPLLINKRLGYLLFGIFYTLIWSYSGMAILVKGFSESMILIAMSAITFLSLFCAMLMIYSGIVVSEKEFSFL